MTDNDAGGNAVDSPTTDTNDQGTSTTQQGADAAAAGATDQTGQSAADSQPAGDGATGGEGTSDSQLPDKDTLPFDQHPKWQSARAAEKRVNEILETHGYDSIEDLAEAASERNNLRELIGNRDAEQIVSDYEEFQRVKKFWAEQEAAKREADETPEDTIVRLKREKQDLIDSKAREEEDRRAIENSQRIVEEFDNDIRSTIKALPDMSDTERSFAIQFMGVDNEIANVDPTNKVEVKRAKEAAIQRIGKFIRDIRQEAVDKYVSGKSDITPVGSSDTGADAGSLASKGDHLPPETTVDQAFAKANEELVEILNKALTA